MYGGSQKLLTALSEAGRPVGLLPCASALTVLLVATLVLSFDVVGFLDMGVSGLLFDCVIALF